MKKKCVAVVLSAGSGKRMNSNTKKQYLLINDKPVIYYSLLAFQKSSIIDEVILVTSADDIEYVKKEIVSKYEFTKVVGITAGGKERYNSVYNGLKACSNCDYVFIHDGARPFVNDEIINRAYDVLVECGSAVVGMPVKDTIKIVDDSNYVKDTPNRKTVWQVQTPQCFEYDVIMRSYETLISEERTGKLAEREIQVTDDAMVLETFYTEESCDSEQGIGKTSRVRLVEGSYENIKITTPEDIGIAELFLNNRNMA